MPKCPARPARPNCCRSDATLPGKPKEIVQSNPSIQNPTSKKHQWQWQCGNAVMSNIMPSHLPNIPFFAGARPISMPSSKALVQATPSTYRDSLDKHAKAITLHNKYTVNFSKP